jgi:hypothetical protein
MQRTSKFSFLKSIIGRKQPAKKQVERKAPAVIEEQQLRQVSGGTEQADSPRGTW